ncbi:MAG: TIGR03009 domain-containing protein [Pirellulales bacterium]
MSRSRSLLRSLLIASLLGAPATSFAQQSYDPARQVDPRLQQQLTPYQQEQLRRAQFEAAQREAAAAGQRDPRVAQNPNAVRPIQYQQPAGAPAANPGLANPVAAPNGQPPNGVPGQAAGGMTPTPQLMPPRAPFQLTPDQEKELDLKLKMWENASAAVKTFESKFICWEYDPVWGPQNAHKTEANGVLKYAAPDKGLFRFDTIKIYNAQSQKYDAGNDVTLLENWVCDGRYIYSADHQTKKYMKRELPPNMRGTQIADGPLPFVFGQKADKLKARFWVRLVTPADVKGQIWLEAFPKYQADAANYKKVDLILDEKTLNPLAIQTYDPNPQTNIRKVYQFSGHAVNGFQFNPFKEFVPTDVPSGYKLVEEPYQEPVAATQQPARPNAIAVPNGIAPNGMAPQTGNNVRPGTTIPR